MGKKSAVELVEEAFSRAGYSRWLSPHLMMDGLTMRLMVYAPTCDVVTVSLLFYPDEDSGGTYLELRYLAANRWMTSVAWAGAYGKIPEDISWEALVPQNVGDDVTLCGQYPTKEEFGLVRATGRCSLTSVEARKLLDFWLKVFKRDDEELRTAILEKRQRGMCNLAAALLH